jgi:flagellar hook-basal body complex protein FliE
MSGAIQGPFGPDPLAPLGQPGKAQGVPPTGGKDFKSVLLDNLDEVNRLQLEADKSVQALYRGETDNVGEVITAVNKAGIAFDLLMEIRNKLMTAYQEIQQIRV